jgi:hypothetical protein
MSSRVPLRVASLDEALQLTAAGLARSGVHVLLDDGAE